MKKCPYCAEEIQDAAVKCRYCGEMLVPRADVLQEKTPIWFAPGFLVISFLCVGPFMLPALWLHPKMSLGRKVLFTVVITILTGVACWIFYESAMALSNSYQLISGI